MLAAFLGQETSVSPVDSRVNVSSRWRSSLLPSTLARRSVCPPLWGLIEESPYSIEYELSPCPSLRHNCTRNS